MITVALDEQGAFENPDEAREPVFIGGIIYDDKQSDIDYDNEQERIEGYLKAVCTSVGCTYPRDLHFYVTRSGTNGQSVAKVKEKLSQTLSEFLSKGTFDGRGIMGKKGRLPKRTGSYHIFSMLKSEEGKKNLLRENVSVLIKDSFASNLYIHMAEDIISRILFHNPVIKEIKKVRLDIATRRVVFKIDNNNRTEVEKKVKEYEQLGYRLDAEHSSDKEKVFLITNSDVYRTAIEREMMNDDDHEIEIDRIGVKSIYYEKPEKRMVFLYLADIICSMLGWRPAGDSSGDWMRHFANVADGFTGKENNLLFFYDVSDNYFKKAWKLIEEKDYYKALSIAYNGMKLEGSAAVYYGEQWYPKIIDRLMLENNKSAYVMAIRKLQESILNNNLNQDKLVYILNALEKLSSNIVFETKEEGSILYELYDTGVAAYCHIGDSKKAMWYFERCVEYAQFIGIERYLGTRNQMVVLLNDSFQPRKALEIALDNYSYHEFISDMKQQLFKDDKFMDYMEHGKALSQLGQAYAFMKDSHAENCFIEALSEFEEGSANYLITMSYLLHYYIQSGEKEKYMEYSKKYFGDSLNPEKQLKYIISAGKKEKNSIMNLKFALFVFVKGLYYFRMDELNEGMLGKLADISGTMKKMGSESLKQINGHPWELICKYLAFIHLEKGNEDVAEKYMQMQDDFIDNAGPVILAIWMFGEAEYALKAGKTDMFNTAISKLWVFIKDKMGLSEDDINEYPGTIDQSAGIGEDVFVEGMSLNSKLSNMITYMYR